MPTLHTKGGWVASHPIHPPPPPPPSPPDQPLWWEKALHDLALEKLILSPIQFRRGGFSNDEGVP